MRSRWLRIQRRRLVSTWRRATRWEFWPSWALYPPVVAHIVGLMVKHRGATLFTAANPAIEAGGFVRESKHQILRGLSGAGEHVVCCCLIDGGLSADAKIDIALRFIPSRGLSFPVVLKPDCGQRGSGVAIVRSVDALRTLLTRSRVDTIVQEYVAGPEFGVFYYRYPDEARGHIFSITEKHMPNVIGDGIRTLEELILEDERAVCAARVYCERFRDRLTDIPARGETVALAELGTHCRGAVFLNGSSLASPELCERFDEIARSFDGFYFGRFDVRATQGIDAFRLGRGIKILELNGVTSEATHIYHPGSSLIDAYRVLMRQWTIAFEIGAENRRRGASVSSLRTLIRLGREYQQISRQHLPEQRMA